MLYESDMTLYSRRLLNIKAICFICVFIVFTRRACDIYEALVFCKTVGSPVM